MISIMPKLPEMRRTLIDFENRLKKIEEAIPSKEKET
jgi:uncharacterized protein YjaG (DUF416 family)